MNPAIRVLVIDDSPFVCRLLASHLRTAAELEVVGMVHDSARAVAEVESLRPDVVTLDLEMPGQNGLEVLEGVMRRCPTPVIMISGVSSKAAAVTLRAVHQGAVDFVLKYTPGADTDPLALRAEIVAKVRMAARIKVIRSLPVAPAAGGKGGSRLAAEHRGAAPAAPPEHSPPPLRTAPFLPGGVLAIGASTGGPVALRELLSGLPADFPAAVIVVQHLPAAFTPVLAAQLNRQVPLRVKEAEDGERLRPGQVFVAPGECHLVVRPDGHIELLAGPRVGGHCPSIDVTMQSVAQAYGPRSRGVILTGMGSDGALGLASIRARGGRTFAQDAASAVIHSMPQQAINRGAVEHVGPPAEIARLLIQSQAVAWGKLS